MGLPSLTSEASDETEQDSNLHYPESRVRSLRKAGTVLVFLLGTPYVDNELGPLGKRQEWMPSITDHFFRRSSS